MKGKLLFLLLVIVIAIVAYFYTRPVTPILSIDRVYNVKQAGETVMVNMTISNIPDCGGWLAKLVWDPYIIALATGGPNSTVPAYGGAAFDLYEGPFMSNVAPTQFIVNEADNTLGIAVVGTVFNPQGPGANGTGILLTMNFTVLHVGTTSIELKPLSAQANDTLLANSVNQHVNHAEVNGLITENAPPPMWAGTDFQSTLILGEIVVLGAVSGALYLRMHPRLTKSAKRKAELQPIIDPDDQVEPD